MLPIRLGMVNANGPQELFVYALTRKGRVETTNYRTVQLPSDMELPVYVKERVRAASTRRCSRSRCRSEDMRAVFLEYAWDMGWCDPCAADPLSNDELRQLGVFWLDGDGGGATRRDAPRRCRAAAATSSSRGCTSATTRALPRGSGVPGDRRPRQLPGPLRPAPRVDRQRHLLARPTTYRRDARRRAASRRPQTLASLTGWDIDEIRRTPGPRAARRRRRSHLVADASGRSSPASSSALRASVDQAASCLPTVTRTRSCSSRQPRCTSGSVGRTGPLVIDSPAGRGIRPGRHPRARCISTSTASA